MRTWIKSAAWMMASATVAMAAPVSDLPGVKPDAIVDLRTGDGAEVVAAQWKYHDAQIVDAKHRAAGPDRKPSGAEVVTHDLIPRAGAAGFNDSEWETIAPESLEDRRSTGKLCAGWYRLRTTLPSRIGDTAVDGATVVLELTADDYAEVWVNGESSTVLGQRGGTAVAGWNSPNQVVLTRDARAGQTFEVGVLVSNGPWSDVPGNFIWIRSATLDVYAPGKLRAGTEVPLEVERLDKSMDAVVPPGARLEKLAEGFGFTEGPVWVPSRFGGAGAKPISRGYLLFSDPNENRIYRWSPEALGNGVSVYRTKSGYAGLDIGRYKQPGSNGLAIDAEGRLTVCEHGNRRITRIEKNGTLTVLADKYEGKRLNSPNDLVYRSDGALYFTDPFFGLPGFDQDPAKELPHQGVYCLKDGELRLVSTDLNGPNGLAFSPDEKSLYVGNWDDHKKVVMRYDVMPDGALSGGSVFFDVTHAPGEEAIDGVKVDRLGNVYFSGPGGVWVVSAQGKHLGTIRCPELPANFAWGDDDRRTLYFTARAGVYRMRMGVAGAGVE